MGLQRTLIVLLALSLTACGYHLRGNDKLPKELDPVYLDGGSAQLRDQFRAVLASSSAKLSSGPEKAGMVVKIISEDFRRRVLSLSSRGRSNEVELDYRFDYELSKAGNILLPIQPYRLRREYFNDQEDIIAKDNEERVIRNEMYRQAVQTILNRAGAALKAGTP